MHRYAYREHFAELLGCSLLTTVESLSIGSYKRDFTSVF